MGRQCHQGEEEGGELLPTTFTMKKVGHRTRSLSISVIRNGKRRRIRSTGFGKKAWDEVRLSSLENKLLLAKGLF